MSSDEKRNAGIGAFLVLGLIGLGWLMSSFGELPAFLGRREYDLRIAVQSASGVGEGSTIMLNGVQIGRVKSVEFRDPSHLDAGVLIIGGIGEEFAIPRTAWAVIQPAGFGLGRTSIEIKVTEGRIAEPLPPGEEISGIVGNVWGDMIPDTLLDSVDRSVAKFGNFVEALTPVANDLHVLLEQHTVAEVDNPIDDTQRLTANISTVIERFDMTLKAFNQTFGDPEIREGFLEMFGNIRQMSSDGREALANINKLTAELRDDVARISQKLETGIDETNNGIRDLLSEMRPILENTSKLTASLVRLSTAIERGDGTVGRLVSDPKLYESLLVSTQRLTALIDTIQRLFDRFEREGAIGVRASTPVGKIRSDIDIPNK